MTSVLRKYGRIPAEPAATYLTTDAMAEYVQEGETLTFTLPPEQYDTVIKASLTRHYSLARRATLLLRRLVRTILNLCKPGLNRTFVFQFRFPDVVRKVLLVVIDSSFTPG